MCNGLSVHAYVTADCLGMVLHSLTIYEYNSLSCDFISVETISTLPGPFGLSSIFRTVLELGRESGHMLFIWHGMLQTRVGWQGNPRSPPLTYHFKSYCCYQFVFFIHVSFVLHIKIYVLILDL